MNRSSHLRNAGLAALLVFLLVVFVTQSPALPVTAQAEVEVNPGTLDVTLAAGTSATPSFTITNNTTDNRTFSAAFSNTPSGFTVTQQSSITIGGNGSTGQFNIIVSAASTVAPGRYGPITVSFSGSNGTNTRSASAVMYIVVSGPTYTPTPTLTRTTGPPTATPTRGPVCTDGFEPDNSKDEARIIDVNTAQEHAICPSGDEDWVFFGGIAGKVYTIDISRMDPGIDLSLEVFDSEMRSIAFNDDFFNRDPANPNAGDIRPRITIRIPVDGHYYVRIRDNAGRGGTDYIYVVALLDESYGPTPTLVREVCQDLFEPDGLPEQARLITSNELQETRRLCPSGDADWVTFFAKAGKRYIIYTDTRRYVGENRVNGETQAGADTVMILADRDGVSLLDVSDDIPGGNTLDSQIEFTPEVDGFYFIQVKNTGDIGGQFIRYDLVLLLCLPGQTDCGRGSTIQTQPVNPITPAPTGTPAQEFTLDPSATPQPAPSPRA